MSVRSIIAAARTQTKEEWKWIWFPANRIGIRWWIGSLAVAAIAATVGITSGGASGWSRSGLLLDVWGAVLLGMPIMSRSNHIWRLTGGGLSRRPLDGGDPWARMAMFHDRTLAVLGMAFLVCGFAFQFVGQF